MTLTSLRANKRVAVAGLFLLGAIVLAGCGESGPATGTVTGKVTYNGQELTSGTVAITFHHVESKAASPGWVEDGGKYKIPNVPAGPVKISVRTAKPQSDGGTKAIPIPEKYANPEKSGLTYTVKSGSQTFDIDLQK